VTPLMIQRSLSAALNPESSDMPVRGEKDGGGDSAAWVGLNTMPSVLVRTIIASEDSKFCEHSGFDWPALNAALSAAMGGRTGPGGSTISMQTAKNVFLLPTRSYLRKAVEAYFTVLIEFVWGKQRILEIYLNVAEWGPGVYGIAAAAHHHFSKEPAQLNAREASLLAVLLPSPRLRSPKTLSPSLQRRARSLRAAAPLIRLSSGNTCHTPG